MNIRHCFDFSIIALNYLAIYFLNMTDLHGGMFLIFLMSHLGIIPVIYLLEVYHFRNIRNMKLAAKRLAVSSVFLVAISIFLVLVKSIFEFEVTPELLQTNYAVKIGFFVVIIIYSFLASGVCLMFRIMIL